MAMNKIYPLYSSSKGNCTYIGNRESGVLVDAGVSCKKICTALADFEIPAKAVKGILVTHTHSDHIKGIKVFAKKFSTPVFAQNINLQIMNDKGIITENSTAYMIDDLEFTLGDFTVRAFPTPHDTPASCGYRLTDSCGKTAVICTDLGVVTPAVWGNLQGTNAVLIESNYDISMLKNGSYPYDLKKRIASDQGHLSNSDCGNLVNNLLKKGTKKFILGHLSEENNLPELAEKSVIDSACDYMRDVDFYLQTALPENNLQAVEIC